MSLKYSNSHSETLARENAEHLQHAIHHALEVLFVDGKAKAYFEEINRGNITPEIIIDIFGEDVRNDEVMIALISSRSHWEMQSNLFRLFEYHRKMLAAA